ncbi:hypothetical protein B0H11DRAFT_2022057 [Mycena galericulata]|nr:hypothetical protein B0H11DRAFT_2022057 [Mycena galericulata]
MFVASTSGESVAALLVSNDAPYPSQKFFVQETLRKKKNELLALETQISALRSRLRIVQGQHTDLAAEITQYRSIISPIRLLPPEIMGEIFLYFVPTFDSYDYDGYSSGVQLPWKLGHICHSWRTIALSLSQLWSVLDLHDYRSPRECTMPWSVRPDEHQEEEDFTKSPPRFEGYNREYEEGHEIETTLDFIRECVRRSGNRPLSLHIRRSATYALSPIIDAFWKYSTRWGEIIMDSPTDFLLTRLAQAPGNFPLLRKIVLASAFQPRIQYQCAPNLTELSLVDVHLPHRSDLDIPWAQLTRYLEDGCTWDWTAERWSSYRKCRNLCVLRLRVSSPLFTTTAPQSEEAIVLFPRLRAASFFFHSSSRTGLAKGLQLFEMPALEVFSIKGPHQSQSNFFSPRHSIHLKVLRIDIEEPMMDMQAWDAEHILELYPNLTEISLNAPDTISNAAISGLIPHNGRLPLAPKLQIIRFPNRSYIHESCQWETLVELLRSRFQPTVDGVATLRSFEFLTDEWAQDEMVSTSLKRLGKEENWDIRVGEECSVLNWDDLHLQ